MQPLAEASSSSPEQPKVVEVESDYPNTRAAAAARTSQQHNHIDPVMNSPAKVFMTRTVEAARMNTTGESDIAFGEAFYELPYLYDIS